MPPLAEELEEPQDERGSVERLPLFHPDKNLEGGLEIFLRKMLEYSPRNFGAQNLGAGLNCQDQ